ncbi:diphthamide synthesis protein, putative [Babesia caballi]|uniref:Diphthamide synthesis protein, putative n=1 Tax=Babesia caballi TaxID=5871 RepID=A0AAV4LUI1_BABCB|nr:diphthamide synthesis protein, putative [Babesia caballi]
MPIRLLFDQAQVDWDKLSPYLRNVLAGCTYSRLVLAYDSALHHLADRLEECLHSTGKTSFIAECRQRVESASDHSSADAASSDNLFCGRRVFARSNTGSRIYVSYNELSIGESDTLVLFVTTGSGRDATTDYIALSCVGSQFHVVTVDNGGISHRNCDDLGHTLRMRRYQKVEKLREASTVGILVIARTLRGSSALRHSLARLVEHHGKRSYTFSVNCLTEAKLANFPNVDLFCLLSCGESVLSLPDELARRVVVPFELLVAFDCVDWSLPYEFDFPRLLPHATASEGTEAAAAGGELRRLQGNLELKVQVESFMSSLQDNSKRTFGGVDPSHGLSEQPAIVPGFHGTASGYEHERRL